MEELPKHGEGSILGMDKSLQVIDNSVEVSFNRGFKSASGDSNTAIHESNIHSNFEFGKVGEVLSAEIELGPTLATYLLFSYNFHRDDFYYHDLGEGLRGLRGLYSSFRATQSGLSLNIDMSSIAVVDPGPVADFFIANQKVKDYDKLDWVKAKKTLKNLRITTSTSNQEYKITRLSELPCNLQKFTLKKKGCESGQDDPEEITVYDYFVNRRNISLAFSAALPCINVGKPN